jgi:enterochelin esterase family protein
VDLHAELRAVTPGIPDRDVPRFATSLTCAEPYVLGPDSQPREGVPRGTVTAHRLEHSGVYPGVTRDYWVYVPAQCRHDEPAALMVFQDGARYVGPEANVPVVFDNLISGDVMPPTVGVFVESGQPGPGLPVYGGAGNRSIEYDTVDTSYARFLLDELLPEVAKRQSLSDGPERRAICGLSLGGICAFTVAWHRPDSFRKVVCHCGSFVDIRGGDAYPSLIRRHEAKPLRVFLQTGLHDLDIQFGGWLEANRNMAAALAYRGYDHRLVIGEGGHSLAHGAAMLPETLRWLWRDA